MVFDPIAWSGAAGPYALPGSGGYVMQMQGTGGGKTTMPAYWRQRIPTRAINANARSGHIDGGATLRSTFSFASCLTTAQDTANGPSGILVDVWGKISASSLTQRRPPRCRREPAR
jgi:hypothetical protein